MQPFCRGWSNFCSLSLAAFERFEEEIQVVTSSVVLTTGSAFMFKVVKALKESFLSTLVVPSGCLSRCCCSMVSDQSAYFEPSHRTSRRPFSFTLREYFSILKPLKTWLCCKNPFRSAAVFAMLVCN